MRTRTLALVAAALLPPVAAYAAIETVPWQPSLIALDVSTVTTGGTAVVALNAGHAVRGGIIENPSGASANLCVNEIGTAGTTTSGGTLCIAAGGTLNLVPTPGPVSVNSSDSSHAFGGVGFGN